MANDAELLKTFLQGWDEAERCLAETLSFVPDSQLVFIIRERQKRLGIPLRSPNGGSAKETPSAPCADS